MVRSNSFRFFLVIISFSAFYLQIISCENGGSDAPQSSPLSSNPDSAYYADLAAEDPAFRLNQQGDSATSAGDYPSAIDFYLKSIDSAGVAEDSFAYFDSKLDLAHVYYILNELPKAISIAEPVLDAFIRSGDSARIGRTYSTLSMIYSRANMPEKTLAAAQNGFNILRNYGSLIERCAAYNQMAFTYSGAGHWGEALPLLDSALAFMHASGTLDQLPSMLLNLGECHTHLGHWAEAHSYLEKSIAGADSLGQLLVHAKGLQRLSQLEESTGNYAGALSIYRKSVELEDSLFTAENNRAVQDLELNYLEKEKEYEISLLQSRHKAENQRFIFALVLLALILGISTERLYRWRKKLENSRLAIEQNQQDLREFAQILVAKNTRIAELEQGLQSTDNAAEKLYNPTILTDADWTAFKTHFDRAYPGYIHRLRMAYPELSGAEERLFLLLKLGFFRQEIGATLGISTDSVKKARTRLRKRLGLMTEDDLEQFVQAF